MAADLVVAAADVAVVQSTQQLTGPAAGVIPAGTPVYLNATTGHFTAGDASAAGTAGIVGVTIDSATIAYQTISVLRKGIMDLGGALDALSFGDSVFLSDTAATMADTAGTVTVEIGTVEPMFGSTTPERVLRIDL
jgi:hypothetical protein